MQAFVRDQIAQSAQVLHATVDDSGLLRTVELLAQFWVRALLGGNKLLFMGNGGSAADSQHLAGEMVSRFAYDRPGLPAFALTTDARQC